MFKGAERIAPSHMENFPLLQLEVLATSSRKVAFAEMSRSARAVAPGEVRSSVGLLVSSISNQQVVASSKSRSIALETANCFVFKRFS